MIFVKGLETYLDVQYHYFISLDQNTSSGISGGKGAVQLMQEKRLVH